MPPSVDETIREIQVRNLRVDADKAWETSKTRKSLVALLTYMILLLLMVVIGVDNPFLSALIPTGGFLLSTLSLNFAKKYWLTYYKKA